MSIGPCVQFVEFEGVFWLSPGTWKKVVYDGKPHVRFCCPNGHTAFLQHYIDEEGKVEPSVKCPVEGCGFHNWIQLVGWKGWDNE